MTKPMMGKRMYICRMCGKMYAINNGRPKLDCSKECALRAKKLRFNAKHRDIKVEYPHESRLATKEERESLTTPGEKRAPKSEKAQTFVDMAIGAREFVSESYPELLDTMTPTLDYLDTVCPRADSEEYTNHALTNQILRAIENIRKDCLKHTKTETVSSEEQTFSGEIEKVIQGMVGAYILIRGDDED